MPTRRLQPPSSRSPRNPSSAPAASMTEVVQRVTSLAGRLRSETSDLHRAVEAVADLPGSVASRADYRDLLSAFRTVHSSVEAAVCDLRWRADWRRLGVDISRHRQLHLVVDDLDRLDCTASGPPRADPSRGAQPSAELGRAPSPQADQGMVGPELTSSAHALGGLYVIEGSAIGRRLLSPMLVARLGDIPTSFFDGAGRHPQAWRDVQRCLAAVPGDEDHHRTVVAGARITFEVFLDRLGPRARHRDATCR